MWNENPHAKKKKRKKEILVPISHRYKNYLKNIELKVKPKIIKILEESRENIESLGLGKDIYNPEHNP